LSIQAAYYGLAAAAIVVGFIWGLLKIAFYVGGKFSSIESSLELILTNHLPHLQQAIDNINERLNG